MTWQEPNHQNTSMSTRISWCATWLRSAALWPSSYMKRPEHLCCALAMKSWAERRTPLVPAPRRQAARSESEVSQGYTQRTCLGVGEHCCSSREPRFVSQHPNCGSQLPISPVQGDLPPSLGLWALRASSAQTHIQAKSYK